MESVNDARKCGALACHSTHRVLGFEDSAQPTNTVNVSAGFLALAYYPLQRPIHCRRIRHLYQEIAFERFA